MDCSISLSSSLIVGSADASSTIMRRVAPPLLLGCIDMVLYSFVLSAGPDSVTVDVRSNRDMICVTLLPRGKPTGAAVDGFRGRRYRGLCMVLAPRTGVASMLAGTNVRTPPEPFMIVSTA